MYSGETNYTAVYVSNRCQNNCFQNFYLCVFAMLTQNLLHKAVYIVTNFKGFTQNSKKMYVCPHIRRLIRPATRIKKKIKLILNFTRTKSRVKPNPYVLIYKMLFYFIRLSSYLIN